MYLVCELVRGIGDSEKADLSTDEEVPVWLSSEMFALVFLEPCVCRIYH